MGFQQFKLGDLADFTSGILLPRITDPVNETPSHRIIYNPLADTSKYVHGDSPLPLITCDQVGLSLLKREAYLVENISQVDEQILTANFASVTLDDNLNRDYFVWWFNHSIEAQRQLTANGQLGRRVVLKDLKNITISVPKIELQRNVGKLNTLGHRQALILREQATLTEQRNLQFIRQKMMKEG